MSVSATRTILKISTIKIDSGSLELTIIHQRTCEYYTEWPKSELMLH